MKTYSGLLHYTDKYYIATEQRLQAKKEYREEIRKENREWTKECIFVFGLLLTMYLLYVVYHTLFYWG